MKKTILAAALALSPAVQPGIPMVVASVAFVGSAEVVSAEVKCEGVCKLPTPVGKGQRAPIHTVMHCIVGPADGDHEIVPCQSSRAVHKTPTGNDGVCFVDENGRPGWDYQHLVWEGRKFIARKIDGVWHPDWK